MTRNKHSKISKLTTMGKAPTITDLDALCHRAAIINALNERKNDTTLRMILTSLGVEEKLLERALARTHKLIKDRPPHFPKPLGELFVDATLREKEFFCAIMWKSTKDTKWNQTTSEVWRTLHYGNDELLPSSQGQMFRFAKEIDPDKLPHGFQAAIPFEVGIDRSIKKIRKEEEKPNKQVVVFPADFDVGKENPVSQKVLNCPPGRPLFDASGKTPLQPTSTKVQIEPAALNQAIPFGKMRYLMVPPVPVGPGATEIRMVYDAATGKLSVDCKMEAEKKVKHKKLAPQARQAAPQLPASKTPMKEVCVPENLWSPLSDVSGLTANFAGLYF